MTFDLNSEPEATQKLVDHDVKVDDDLILESHQQGCTSVYEDPEGKASVEMVEAKASLQDQSVEKLELSQDVDSGTSTSAVVNAAVCPNGGCECEASSDQTTDQNQDHDQIPANVFTFLLIKPTAEASSSPAATVETFPQTNGIISKESESAFVTRELFPLQPSGSTELFSENCEKSARSQYWARLNLFQTDQRPKSIEVSMPAKKSRRGPRSRSSEYRGVTFYRRTGRWESHIWDSGKQVYLGGFDTAHAAAKAYDKAAIKFRGLDADINFSLTDYDEDIKQMEALKKEELIHILRRQSTGFSRGSSKFRGVTLHKCGRWEARMGQFLGKKAYDKAAIRSSGREAVTNFDPSTYEGEIQPELQTNGFNQLSLQHNLGVSLTKNCSSPTSHLEETGRSFGYLSMFNSFSEQDWKRARLTSSALQKVHENIQGVPTTFNEMESQVRNLPPSVLNVKSGEALPSFPFTQSGWSSQVNSSLQPTDHPVYFNSSTSSPMPQLPCLQGSQMAESLHKAGRNYINQSFSNFLPAENIIPPRNIHRPIAKGAAALGSKIQHDSLGLNLET